MGNLVTHKMNQIKHQQKMGNYWKKEQKQDIEKANQSKPKSQGQ